MHHCGCRRDWVIAPVASAHFRDSGSCDLLFGLSRLNCEWSASGDEVEITIDNDSDDYISCTAEATFEILWDTDSADIRPGNSATLELPRDPSDSEWYEVSCTSDDGSSSGSDDFLVWRD